MGFIYSREFSDEEVKIVEHYTIDFNQWIEQAITGKINSCKKRLLKEEWDKRIENNLDLPKSSDALIQEAFLDANYLNRKQREENDQSTSIAI